MKFAVLACLATGAFAGTIFGRDLSTVKSVLSVVGDNIAGLDSAVKSFDGNPLKLLTASDTLIKSLNDGKTKVDKSSGLSIIDTLGLLGPIIGLQNKADSLVADLKAKKTIIAKNGFCAVTLSQTTTINTATQNLINSVVAKVPGLLQGIARGLTSGLSKDLRDAMDIFSPANCKDSTPPITTSSTARPTSTAPPGTTSLPDDGCPAAQTVTVTAIDTKGCVPTKALFLRSW